MIWLARDAGAHPGWPGSGLDTRLRVLPSSIGGQRLAFISLKPDAHDKGSIAQDEETQSLWDFHGCAIEGKLKGQCLPPLDSIKDYWFDWLNHHPATDVYKN